MPTWGDYRTQLRRSVLADVNKITWTDDALLDYCSWALDTFSAHTALATSVEYTGVDQTVALPDNVCDSIESAGLVYLTTSGGSATYLPPWDYDLDYRSTTFREWPDHSLTFSESLPATATLHVDYYAFYPRPESTSDLLLIPRWAEGALGFLIAAYAMTGVSTTSGNIRQWNGDDDSGNPEHNPLLRLQNQFFMKYESEIARRQRQDRINFGKRFG